MLSERTKLQWGTYVAARQARITPFGDRDELQRFLVGLHLRGEELTLPELHALLDQVGLDSAERESLIELVEAGLELLEAYDEIVAAEDAAYDDPEQGGFRI